MVMTGAIGTTAGCSFALPDPQVDYRPTEEPTCTSSRSSPAGDLFVAGASLFFLASSAACEGNREGDDQDTWLGECNGAQWVMITTGALATVAIIAAVRGFINTSACRKQWRQHRRCLAGEAGQCAAPEPELAPEPADGEQPSAECLAHKQAIRAAKDPQARLRLIQRAPSQCLQ